MSGFDNEVMFSEGAEIGNDAKGTTSDGNICVIRRDFDGATILDITNTNSGSDANVILNLINDSTSGTISLPSSTYTISSLQNRLFVNADSSDNEGIIYNVAAGKDLRFYAPVSQNNEILRIDASGISFDEGASYLTTPVDETVGGTGQTTYTTGDILYASAANTLSKLGAGSDGDVLTLASGVPSWAAASGGSLQTAEVTLTSAQVKALHTTPVQIIAAPSSGNYYQVFGGNARLNYGGNNAFVQATPGFLRITASSQTSTPPSISFVDDNDFQTFIQRTSDYYIKFRNDVNTTYSSTVMEESIVISLSEAVTGNAANDNTLTVQVWYTEETF